MQIWVVEDGTGFFWLPNEEAARHNYEVWVILSMETFERVRLFQGEVPDGLEPHQVTDWMYDEGPWYDEFEGWDDWKLLESTEED